MTGDAFEKPPSPLLPPAESDSRRRPDRSSSEAKEKLAEKSARRFAARYDAFHGILKRVSEMKLNGSLDSEEPSTGSEMSESSTPRRPKRRVQTESVDGCSNASNFEDESSVSSVGGSDPCCPCEEISRVNCGGYGCGGLPGLPAFPAHVGGSVSSFGNEFAPSPPSPPSPAAARQRVPSKEYKGKTGSKRQSEREPVRPKSGGFGGGGEATPVRQFLADFNDNRTEYREGASSPEERGEPGGISEGEKHQLEMFFRSLKTDVFVCGSLANLYFGWKEDEGNWTYRHTGAVVVVFDSGDTRSRNKRRIQILLAEKGTCFPLWRDTIDNLSAYRRSGVAFHTMYLSSDHRQMAGLSFDCHSEAEKLLKHLEELTADPENINISGPSSRKKKTTPKKKPPCLPHKKQISNPCLFQHVTSVAARDKPIYVSLQTLIDDEMAKQKENIS